MPETFRTESAGTFGIDFEPLGRRGAAHTGQTLLEAAQAAGIGLAAICGGAGTCLECRVRLAAGKLTPPTSVEQNALNENELAAGLRLACQARPLSDIKLDLPPESLTASQRLQLEGQETDFKPRPAVGGPNAYGLAVDVGTTKLAAYLVHLESGKTVARAGAINPQVAYGEDVISRIAYATRETDGAKKLQAVLIETLDHLLDELCAEVQIPTTQVSDAVLVGNTVMQHLLAELPVEQLGRAPFSPASAEPLHFSANKLGLNLAPDANVYLPPVIAGYVGADHLAMLLAIQSQWLSKGGKTVIALDIGTNTEISLIAGEKITCCSCASGPAFEGAHIHEGMRAAPGAIERSRWSEGRLLCQTIEAQPPIGICGSGILDIVAALLDGSQLKASGALQTGGESEYVLVPAFQSGNGRAIVVTRKDIHEIQLAKSAIRAGIETLLQHAGLTSTDLDEFILAGAFGTYLDLRSAVRVGMFPPLPMDRFRQVGNAAGIGAKQMLTSLDKRREAERIASKIRYVELTSRPAFTSLFIKYLSFEV